MKQRLLLIAFGSALGVALFVALDLLAGIAIGNPRDVVREGSVADKGFIIDDERLGYRPKPGVVVTARERTQGGEVLYDVSYSIDQFSRRVTPQASSHSSGRFALFFGCSFSFGEGLPDSDTLPAAFARIAPEYAVYNYAFGGYGPQQLYMKLGDPSLRSEIPEKHGALVYTFIDAHVDRLIGSSYVHNGWCQRCPYLALSGSGEIEHRGTFTSGRPIRAALYWLLAQSFTAKLFNVSFPRSVTSGDVALTAKVIGESRKRFEGLFPGSEFYVLIYPGSARGLELAGLLAAMGIKTIDLAREGGFQELPLVISPKDPHPSGEANERLAVEVAEALRAP